MSTLGSDVPWKVALFLVALVGLLILCYLDQRAEAKRRHPSSKGRDDG